MGGGAAGAGVRRASAPSPLTRPAGCPAPRRCWAPRSARPELCPRQRGPRAARPPGHRPLDGPAPASSATHPRPVCGATPVLGLASGSAVFTSNPWRDHRSLPGGPVPRSGGCSRPRLAGTIAGSLVSGGLRRWLLFGRALPPPPATRARDHALAPRVMALQAACLPLVSIFGGRLRARPRARTGPIPAGETQPQVSAPNSAYSPGRRGAGAGGWSL